MPNTPNSPPPTESPTDPPARRSPTLVAFDVGNTTTVIGVWVGDELVHNLRISTDPERTADELGAVLAVLLERADLNPATSGGVIVSSVVPPLNITFARLGRSFFGCEPLFVEPGIKTGMAIRYDNPAEVGADRIVNALAAREAYGAPVIVVDFGTALTFDLVNDAGEYVGGIIAPGIGIASEALFAQASKLYRVDVQSPGELVGKSTAAAMQSGLYFGWIGLVDGILERLLERFPGMQTIVGTGGQAELIAGGSRYLNVVDPHLTLTGLKLIYEQNRTPRA